MRSRPDGRAQGDDRNGTRRCCAPSCGLEEPRAGAPPRPRRKILARDAAWSERAGFFANRRATSMVKSKRRDSVFGGSGPGRFGWTASAAPKDAIDEDRGRRRGAEDGSRERRLRSGPETGSQSLAERSAQSAPIIVARVAFLERQRSGTAGCSPSAAQVAIGGHGSSSCYRQSREVRSISRADSSATRRRAR